MNAGKTLFAQIMEFIPWTSFARIVERHSVTLVANANKPCAMGLRHTVQRPRLADGGESRDWRM